VKSQRHYPHLPDSVGQARRFVVDALSDLSEEQREDVAVMVSELATNAYRHGDSPFVVCIDQDRTRVLIEVTDNGAGEPKVCTPGPTEFSGRGLRIVASLSDDWGVTHDNGGKTVWFEVTVPNHR